MTKHVGIFEAKTHLSALLDEVENGGEVLITRHGRPVARLVQAQIGATREQIERRREAIERIRAMAKARGTTTSLEEIKSWIEDGRR